MIPFEYYISLHEKECYLTHTYPHDTCLRDSSIFKIKSKLECLKHVITLIPNKEEFLHYFRFLLHEIISSNDIEKINYFFNFDVNENRFIIPRLENEIENERMEWLYSRYIEEKQLDLKEFIDCSITGYHYVFIKKAIFDWNFRFTLSLFDKFSRLLVYSSIGYTGQYWGFYETPGDMNLYKEFYNLEIWKCCIGDEEKFKSVFINNLLNYLDRIYLDSITNPIDFNDEWWINFLTQNKEMITSPDETALHVLRARQTSKINKYYALEEHLNKHFK